MSYRLGPHASRIGRDFLGRRVMLLRDMENRGGAKFLAGTEMVIRRVWTGKATLRIKIGEGIRPDGTSYSRYEWLTGVSGYDFTILPKDGGPT